MAGAGGRERIVSKTSAAEIGALIDARGGVTGSPSSVTNTCCAEPVIPVSKVLEGRRSEGRPEEETVGAEVLERSALTVAEAEIVGAEVLERATLTDLVTMREVRASSPSLLVILVPAFVDLDR